SARASAPLPRSRPRRDARHGEQWDSRLGHGAEEGRRGRLHHEDGKETRRGNGGLRTPCEASAAYDPAARRRAGQEGSPQAREKAMTRARRGPSRKSPRSKSAPAVSARTAARAELGETSRRIPVLAQDPTITD